ncbi:DUF2271 domain-containing protein [Sphingomonas sp. Leaf242]|uniref:DUF2271 domain-containing protein n=1 Tax=Sphingomonas sp. Leaf242 TaxID=1736304 RepID=UPI0007143DD3|nr:DUF2271 domain-containing protein [Sphingomonas sp. Leaf242]KQO05114.1 hypothetical protein ASF09_17040 [Sphingomonas sp. Leaf242]
MRPTALLLFGGAITAPALSLPASAAPAGTVTITIPQLSVAEYHKPYVAVWLEPVGGGAPRTLAVWYDLKKRGNDPGTKWLADLRAWWRKGGRSMTMPADGISGATRAPGQYTIPLPADIKPGQYVLNVEAARETGGRELVSVPLTAGARTTGKTELGAVAISAR